jgi:preprotein translocase subunit SecD
VPYVDYKVYPDGVDATDGVDISGNFTAQSAKDMAVLLRYGPLPVNLRAAG